MSMKHLSWLMSNDEKYNDVNVSTSISTLCRDLSDTTPIGDMQSISTLQHFKQLYDEEKKDPKNKKSAYKKLNSADKIRAQNAEKMLSELTKKIKIVPDDWQRQFIKELDTPNSVIVFAPTGSGKTFTSIKAFMSVIHSKKTIVYVAPYFYLAFQMLANVREHTSSDINFITEHYKQIPPESNIYIGTSRELYTHFKTTNTTFDVGIFDEIHTISNTYSTDINYYAGLVKMCKEKMIGLSATVSSSDTQRLVNYLSEQSSIPVKQFTSIVHTQRAVPLHKHSFTKKGISDTLSEKIIPKSNKEYMRCFLELRKKDWMPLLCFQSSNLIAWKDYVSFTSFLKEEEERENYVRKYAIELNPKIQPLLEELLSIEAKIKDANTSSDKTSDMGIDRLTKSKEAIEQKLDAMRNTVVNILEKELVVRINDFVEDKLDSDYIDDSLSEKEQESMKTYVEYTFKKITKTEVEFDECFLIPGFTYLYKTIFLLKESERVLLIPDGKNPFFVFGRISPDLSLYKVLKEVGGVINERINKKRKSIKLLGRAEGVKDVDEMYSMLDTFIQGLEYGIGILVPTIPFLLQIEMLNFLTKKYIGCIFASCDMAVGINYPLRSVLICSPSDELYTYPLSLRIQMEGRCGRRGKDTSGHIVYWNIGDLQRSENDIESLVFPKSFCEELWKKDICPEVWSDDITRLYPLSELSRDYLKRFVDEKPYPKYDSNERFIVLTEVRNMLGKLQQYYYYDPTHSGEVFKTYEKLRSFIHSLRVFC
jgi:superfamily II DNA or RNA helicase